MDTSQSSPGAWMTDAVYDEAMRGVEPGAGGGVAPPGSGGGAVVPGTPADPAVHAALFPGP